MAELEASAKEAEAERQREADMVELFVRREPLGQDRLFRIYWSFDGDHRLWVQERVSGGGGVEGVTGTVTSNGTPGLEKGLRSLVKSRPGSREYVWRTYSCSAEIWALLEALDGRGEREAALKAAIQKRFDVEEPQYSYLRTGHEWIGRRVLRKFSKVQYCACVALTSGGWGHAKLDAQNS